MCGWDTGSGFGRVCGWETGSGFGCGDGQEIGSAYHAECGSDGEKLDVECWRNGEELGSGYNVESRRHVVYALVDVAGLMACSRGARLMVA